MELLTRYGKIDLIWFDGPGLDYITREEIYAYQPHIVIGRAFETDFRSTECELPDEDYYEKNLNNHISLLFVPRFKGAGGNCAE